MPVALARCSFGSALMTDDEHRLMGEKQRICWRVGGVPCTRWRFVKFRKKRTSSVRQRRHALAHWRPHLLCDLLDAMRSFVVRPLFGNIQTQHMVLTMCEKRTHSHVYVRRRHVELSRAFAYGARSHFKVHFGKLYTLVASANDVAKVLQHWNR